MLYLGFQAQNLSCLCMSIFQSSQLSVGRGQEGMAILVIGCTANRFTQPVLRIVILSEVIVGHARHQRRKMRDGMDQSAFASWRSQLLWPVLLRSKTPAQRDNPRKWDLAQSPFRRRR